jgi:hypothetical protein
MATYTKNLELVKEHLQEGEEIKSSIFTAHETNERNTRKSIISLQHSLDFERAKPVVDGVPDHL